MKKVVFFVAVLLGLTVITVSPATACNHAVAQTRVFTTSNFVGFNPAVTTVAHGFTFNAFAPATLVTNVPVVNEVFINKKVVQKNVVKQKDARKVKQVSKTKVR